MSETKALTFDVFGTVVDWRTSIAREGRAFGERHGIEADWVRFAEDWRGLYQPSLSRVRDGQRPWTPLDDLHRESLRTLLGRLGVAVGDGGVSDAAVEELNRAWHRLDPWPDVLEGLARLKRRYVLATLSNGNVALMVNMAKRAGLPWDAVLGAEVRAPLQAPAGSLSDDGRAARPRPRGMHDGRRPQRRSQGGRRARLPHRLRAAPRRVRPEPDGEPSRRGRLRHHRGELHRSRERARRLTAAGGPGSSRSAASNRAARSCGGTSTNAPPGKTRREPNRPETDSHEPADTNPLRLPQAVDFAIPALPQNDAVPAVGPLPSFLLDAEEPCRTIVQLHPALEVPDHRRVHVPEDPNRVLAVHRVARVHQAVGELAVGGEQHQARGVDVEPADRHPTLGAQTGQALEDSAPAFRVAARRHLSGRLVVGEQAAGFLRRNEYATPVDPDLIAGAEPGARGGHAAVDPNPPLRHPLIHGPTRSDPGRREALLDAFGGDVISRLHCRRKIAFPPAAIGRAPAVLRPSGRARPRAGRNRRPLSSVPRTGRCPSPSGRSSPVRRPGPRTAWAPLRSERGGIRA